MKKVIEFIVCLICVIVVVTLVTLLTNKIFPFGAPTYIYILIGGIFGILSVTIPEEFIWK